MEQADRVNGTKKSGLGQSVMSRFSSSMDSCLLDLKLRWLCWKIDGWKRKQFNKHCKKGYHRLERIIEARGPKPRIRVEYLACQICDYKFFSTVKDKNRWLMLNSSKRNAFKKLFNRNKTDRNVKDKSDRTNKRTLKKEG